MQVPEKLSLIGGSILLASTLVFTLKGQASNILPKVDSGMSSLVNADKSGQSSNGSSQSQQPSQQDQQKQQQAQADQTFNNNFQQAQQKGWQTGQWGTAKFYVDNQGNMYVGSGLLQGPSYNAIGVNQYESLKTITLDGNVQAPSNSAALFGAYLNYSITAINNLSNLDTSQVTNAFSMFGFLNKASNLDVSHFDTHNVTNMDRMFDDDGSLSNLDLSHFDTHNVNDMENMFDGDDIHQLSLGSDTKLQDSSNTYLNSAYRSNGQTSNLVDGNAHPGTWTKQ